jgi:pyridoxal phosphate enzyme (YggS family)
VDRVKPAEALSLALKRRNDMQSVLLEVNIAREPQKSGFLPEEALQAFEAIRGMPGLHVSGLMCMGPQTGEPEAMRPHFRRAKELWDELRKMDPRIIHLSMGMSQDFEIAIEEGSNMVRVGRAIFGERPARTGGSVRQGG